MKQKHYVSENIKIKVGAAVVIWVLVVIAIVLVLPKSHKKNFFSDRYRLSLLRIGPVLKNIPGLTVQSFAQQF